VLASLRDGIRAGAADRAALLAAARGELEQHGFRPDYVEIRRATDLARPRGESGEALVVLGAAWLGRARLIDNLLV
jgi:pantoate--beta-alanine ligase